MLRRRERITPREGPLTDAVGDVVDENLLGMHAGNEKYDSDQTERNEHDEKRPAIPSAVGNRSVRSGGPLENHAAFSWVSGPSAANHYRCRLVGQISATEQRVVLVRFCFRSPPTWFSHRAS